MPSKGMKELRRRYRLCALRRRSGFRERWAIDESRRRESHRRRYRLCALRRRSGFREMQAIGEVRRRESHRRRYRLRALRRRRGYREMLAVGVVRRRGRQVSMPSRTSHLGRKASGKGQSTKDGTRTSSMARFRMGKSIIKAVLGYGRTPQEERKGRKEKAMYQPSLMSREKVKARSEDKDSAAVAGGITEGGR